MPKITVGKKKKTEIMKAQGTINSQETLALRRVRTGIPRLLFSIEVSFNGNTPIRNHNRCPSELRKDQQK